MCESWKRTDWRYREETEDVEKSNGPVSTDDIVSLFENGVLTEKTLLWCPVFGQVWTALCDIPDMREAVGMLPDKEVEKKKKEEENATQVTEKLEMKRKRRKKSEVRTEWFELSVNTNVYATNLPEDVTEEELESFFSQCGVIKKVKLYKTSDGKAKGDGIVSYLKQPSVKLAESILNGALFRPKHKIVVEEAVFKKKEGQYAPRRMKRLTKQEKLKREKKLQWTLVDDVVDDTVEKKNTRVVVLGPMYDDKDVIDDGVERDDVAMDIKNVCGNHGKVKTVELNINGIVLVHYRDSDAGKKCVMALNGRKFAGRTVQSYIWDGSTQYEPLPRLDGGDRLENFAAWAEDDESGKSV